MDITYFQINEIASLDNERQCDHSKCVGVGRSEIGFLIENYVYNHRSIRLFDIFPQQCDRRIRHRGINGTKGRWQSCVVVVSWIYFFLVFLQYIATQINMKWWNYFSNSIVLIKKQYYPRNISINIHQNRLSFVVIGC